MDAGNPDAESRKEARGEEFINDPKGMAAAIVQGVGGEAVSCSVMRGPATAQEGEAHSKHDDRRGAASGSATCDFGESGMDGG